MKAFITLAIAASLCAPAQSKVVGGPYVVNVTSNSAVVKWVVQDGQVSLGETQGKLDRTSPALHTERVSYANLQPGRTYYYDVLGGRPEGKGSFKTAPTAASPFEFVLYGDTRNNMPGVGPSRHDVHRKVIATMLAHSAPDFTIQTGDLVENPRDSAQWPIYFDIERDWLRKVSFYPLAGNHERNDRSFFDLFEAKPYYSFDWGTVHFMALDTDLLNMSPVPRIRNEFWAEELKWLEDELKASQNAPMRFVMAHHGPISAFSTRAPEPHTADLMPLFEKYKVTAGLFGHDHNYQHYLKNGVHYIISGGGGAPLYNVDNPPKGITQKVVSIENFLVFKVDGRVAHVTAYDINGKVIESFELKN